MDVTMIGIDIAKEVFQICGTNCEGKVILKKRLTRKQLVSYIAQLPSCLIAMEACSGAHHWYRTFTQFGHTVKLIAPQFVKPFVKGNKNDQQDAQAITEAASRPEMRYVSPKTLEQQDWQSLLRMRDGAIAMRTKLCNQVRGLLSEYGVIAKRGVHSLRNVLPKHMDSELNDGLTPMIKELLGSQYTLLLTLDKQIDYYDKRLAMVAKNSDTCQRLMTIPGVGIISAIALVTTAGNGAVFKNGRHFSAFLGLVPKQRSSGNQQQLLGISKRGDRYLRQLLIHGARAVQKYSSKKSDRTSQWLVALGQRAHKHKACVALANRNARIALAILKSGETYRQAT